MDAGSAGFGQDVALPTSQTAKCSLSVALMASVVWAQPCSPATVELVSTNWPGNVLRWRAVAANLYSVACQDTYVYGDASVTVSFES